MNLDYTKIQDNVNKYRYGVLIGNYNEETFGTDNKKPPQPIPNSTTKDKFTLRNTVFNVPKESQTLAQKEYHDQVEFCHRGLQHHLLDGHGQQSYFEKRQLTTTYDLSFNKSVKPQVQIYSKYEPDKTILKNMPKQEEVTDKVQHIVPDMRQVKSDKRHVVVNEFKKTFDANHIKIPLRK